MKVRPIKMEPCVKKPTGFTLVEMAIVLVIIGLLLGGLLMPLSAQLEQQRISETQKYLEQIKEALLGFAAANGRLPCPASATSNGQESFAVGGNATNGLCSNFYNGFLPAATLGLTPTDSQGYAVDAWGLTQNRIRYAIYTGSINSNSPTCNATPVTNSFTRKDGIRGTTMDCISQTTPLLSVCASATGITAADCGAATVLTRTTPVIIYSLGKNAASGGTGADESANPNPNSANNDQVFISHAPTQAGAANGEFDDIVTWLSVNTLFSRMIAAGALP